MADFSNIEDLNKVIDNHSHLRDNDFTMYICICNQVTERDIQHAAAEGCCSMRALKEKTGLGTQCGTCCKQGADVLKACVAEMNAFSDAEPA